MSDLRDSLDRILILCNTSRTYTRRTQQIHEVAMIGLGMTEGQRVARHTAIYKRVGDGLSTEAFLRREARRAAKEAANPSETPP